MNRIPRPPPLAPIDGSKNGEVVQDLKDILNHFIDILQRRIEIEEKMPGREELRKRIKRVEKISRDLLIEIMGDRPSIPRISDPIGFPLERILLIGDEKMLPHLRDIHVGLKFLTARCGEKLAEMPGNKGRSKIAPDNPRILCALMVSAVYEIAHKRLPGHTNQKVHQLCAELWRKAGGVDLGHAKGSRGWENHLKTALASQNSQEAMYLRKTLGLPNHLTPKGTNKSHRK